MKMAGRCQRLALLLIMTTSVLAAERERDGGPIEGMQALLPATAEPCAEDAPNECICVRFDVHTELPARYVRARSCPHPVLQGIERHTTYTADDARVDDFWMREGVLHGAAVSWHPNGQLASVGQYDDGQPSGFVRTWHANGQPAAELRYADGQLDGIEVRYDTSGRPSEVVVWQRGTVDRERTAAIRNRYGLPPLKSGAPEPVRD